MKRLLPLLLCLFLLIGCIKSTGNEYSNAAFTAILPDTFEPLENVSIVCFAPHGNPLLSSSITYASTELNWYFDRFTEAEYAEELSALTGYESLVLESVEPCKVDGCDARRIACKVVIEQGTHDLIVYAISADRLHIFTLLNREGDSFVAPFDAMMKTLGFTEES